MKILLSKFIAMLSFLLLCGTAQGSIIHFSTVLSGLNEIPPNGSTATGSGDVYYDDVAHTLQVNLAWSGLTGTTTAAHMHAPANATQIATAVPFNGTWGVATQPGTFTGFPTGTTSGWYSGAAYSLLDAANYTAGFLGANGASAAAAEAALLAYMQSGKAYLNIHSSTFPGGEIKGYLRQVPERTPTILFMMLALGCLFFLPALRKTLPA